jgi:hypothetical protein
VNVDFGCVVEWSTFKEDAPFVECELKAQLTTVVAVLDLGLT